MYNIFDLSEFQKEGLLTEAVEVKVSNMNAARFERFLKASFLRGKLGGLTVNVGDVTVPAKPRREKNPLTKEELQSYRVKATFQTEGHKDQRAEFLVQFEAAARGKKLDSSARGYISQIKIDGTPLRINSRDASNRNLTSIVKAFRKGIESERKEVEAQKDDSGQPKKFERLGQSAESDKKRKRVAAGTSDEKPAHGNQNQKKRAASLTQRLKKSKENITQARQEVAEIQATKGRLESRIAEQEARISELGQRKEELTDRLQTLQAERATN